MSNLTVNDIRKQFANLRKQGEYSEDGNLELTNVAFNATEDTIFSKPVKSYIKDEIAWFMACGFPGSHAVEASGDLKSPIYLSIRPARKYAPDPWGRMRQSTSDERSKFFKAPKIWQDIASRKREVNSNYGPLVFSYKNHSQFDNVFHELRRNKHSRRGLMIYIRPTMHKDARACGMNDFVCTLGTHLLIRNNALNYQVIMRSNDAVFGYKNNYAWHKYILDLFYKRYVDEVDDTLKLGDISWYASTLHVYPRHFKFVDQFIKEGKI